jgi:hypothetical protein
LNRDLTEDPPRELAQRVSVILEDAAAQLAARNFRAAFYTAREAYDALFQAQPEGRRFNKSRPLWLEALAASFGKLGIGGAKRAALLAIFEEALTRAESSQGYLGTPLPSGVARNAQVIAELTPDELGRLQSYVSNAAQTGRVIQDPEVAASETDLIMIAAIGSPELEEQEEPGQFSSKWSERVFVGGDYAAHLAELSEIAGVIKAHGWDPILAWRYYAPPPLVHHHSLMLLHECRWAVFEVTSSAGQLMELERTRDYGIRPLVVLQGTKSHGRVSAMVRDLLVRTDNSPMKYSSMKELRLHVDNYLNAARAEVALDSA